MRTLSHPRKDTGVRVAGGAGRRVVARLRARVDAARRAGHDAGMATAEYAIATLAACGFAGLLVAILTGGQVRGMLLGIIRKALAIG